MSVQRVYFRQSCLSSMVVYNHICIVRLCNSSYALPRPRLTPVPLTVPLAGRLVAVVDPRLAVRAVLELVVEWDVLGVLPNPLRTLPLVVPRVLLAPCVLFLSSSSAFRAAASLCCCSSCSRLSAACCLNTASFSISAASCVAPCQLGFRINRWLCSVCERTRVQVLRRVEAELTVRDTVWSPI